MKDYHINIYYSDNDGCFVADIPDLEGCRVFAPSQEAAFTKILDAKSQWLENARREGREIPAPQYRPNYKEFDESLVFQMANAGFVSFLTLEMGTRLMAAKGYLDLIEGGHVGELSDKQREFLGTAQENIKHAHNILLDANVIARIQQGEITLNTRTVNINNIVEAAIQQCHPTIERLKASVNFDPDPNLPEMTGDEALLGQVFQYLIEEVIRYTIPNVPVEVTVAQEMEFEKSVIICTIKPQNLPPPRSTHPVAQSPYYPYHPPWSSDLRASVAKPIIEFHGGTLRSISDDISKSAYRLSLPVVAE